RSRFAEWIEADAELAVRRRGIERLRRYRTSLESRKAAGQGIAADLLKTDVRLAADEADAIDAESRRSEATVELNVLMGLPADAPLALAPLPPPVPLAPAAALLSVVAPEIAEAQALQRGAQADIRSAQADRRPPPLAS